MAIPPIIIRALVPRRYQRGTDRLLTLAMLAIVAGAVLGALAVWLIAPWAGTPAFIVGAAAAVSVALRRR